MKRIFEINLSSNFRCDKGYPSRYRAYRTACAADEKVWQKATAFLPGSRFDSVLIFLGDCVQYASHPELSVEGAWSREKLTEELKRLKELGLEPLPYLDLGAARDAWLGDLARYISTERYRGAVTDIIKEICDIFGGPALFHLGMGSETPETQRFKLLKRSRSLDQWAEDLKRFSDAVRESGSRPWIWADRFLEDREAFAQAVPRDTVLSTQSYGNIKRRTDGKPGFRDEITNSALELEELGYDQIVSSSVGHSFPSNTGSNLELACFEMKNRPLGIMSYPDCTAEEDDLYRLQYAASNFAEAYDRTAVRGEKK